MKKPVLAKRKAKVLLFRKKKPIVESFLMVLSAAKSPLEVLYPGLVLSWLPEKSQFYGSVVRYDGSKKEILRNSTASSVDEVIFNLADWWVQNQGKHIKDLQNALKVQRKLKK